MDALEAQADEYEFPNYEVATSEELDAAPAPELTSEAIRAMLTKPSEEVDAADFGSDELTVLVDQLNRLCFGHYGLSAVQVGFPVRVFVLGDQAGRGVFINPGIDGHGRDVETGIEACVSLPGVRRIVRRWRVITATWHDIDGRPHRERLSGKRARAFQHELDHLNGVLITDDAAGVPLEAEATS